MADIQANIGIGVDTSQALAAIRQLQREISAFHTSMAKGGALASANSARLSQNLVNTVNATGQFSAGMTRIQSGTESFTNALEKNKLSMGQYFRFAGGASRSFGKMFSREFGTINRVATERVKDLQTQYISMGRDANGALQAIKVRPLALNMDNLGTKVQMVAQKQQLFNQLLRQGSTNLLNFGKNTQWAGRQLMVGFTIPLTIFGALAIKEFQKIEEQAVKFRRVYGDMFNTDADTEKALANVRELAEEFTKYGIAVEKTIGLAAKVAQMGNVGTALTEQVTQATRLSVLGGIEQEEALDTTISLTNAFGIAAEDLSGKIAFLNAAENQTILAIEDFNTAIPLSGSVVRQLGGDVEDLAVLLTAMREGGINASQAGNALKSSLGRLIAPSRNAKETLGSFGIDVLGIVNNNAGDLMGTINTLAFALEKLDPLSRARSIEALFGKFQFARMSTMFQNIVKEGSQANKVLGLAANSTAELAIIAERELKAVEQSPAFKLQKQMEELKASLAPIGEEFVKAIGPLIEFGTRLLKSFNNLGEGGKQFVVILTALAGVVAPAVLMVVGLVANGIANLVKFVALLGRGFARLSGSSKILGTGTAYMTQEQIEAATVAASLGQSHSRLLQVFTAETTAVRNLAAAYRQAIVAQRGFGGAAVGMRGQASAPAPKKLAKGGIIRGPGTGTSDSIMAMLSDGEAVIPAAAVRENPEAVNQLISGNIPGFSEGGTVNVLGKNISTDTNLVPLERLANRLNSISTMIPGILEDFTDSLVDGGKMAASTMKTKLNELAEEQRRLIGLAEYTEAGGGSDAQTGMVGGHTGGKEQVGPQAAKKLAGSLSPGEARRQMEASDGGTLHSEMVLGITAQENAHKGGQEELSLLTGKERAGYYKDPDNQKMIGSSLEDGGYIDLEDPAQATDFSVFTSLLAAKLEAAGAEAVSEADFGKFVGEARSEMPEGKAKTGMERAENTYKTFNPAGPDKKRYNLPTGESIVRDPETGELAHSTAAPGGSYQQRGAKLRPQFAERAETAALKNVKGAAESQGYDTTNLDALIQEARSAGADTGQGVIDGYSDTMQIASPSKRMFGLGKNSADSLADGFEQGMADETGKPPLPGNLAAPKAPTPPPMAPPSRGARLKNAVLDSGPSKFLGKKLAQASGNAVTDSKGKVFYDPNKDPNSVFGKMEAKAAADRAGLPGGANYSPNIPDVAGGAPLPVRVVDGFEMDPQFQETMESGQIQTEDLSETLAKNVETTDQNTKTSKEVIKTDKRQRRMAAAGKAMGAVGGLTMAAGMATQAPGVIGETAQKIVGPLAALTGIAPLLMGLPAPIAALVAVIGAGVAAWMMYNKTINEARKKAYELTKALGTGSEALQKYADFTGKARPSEVMDKQRLEQQTPFQIQPGKTPFGQAFLEQDSGQELLSSVRGAIDFQGMEAAQDMLTQQLQAALIEGSLTQEQARGIALALGQELNDLNFSMNVNAKLLNIFGPNGENLESDPLSYTIALNAELTAQTLESGANLAQLTEDYSGFDGFTKATEDTVSGFTEEMAKVEPWLESNVPGWARYLSFGIIDVGAKVTAGFKGLWGGALEGATMTAEEVGRNAALITGTMQAYANNLDAIEIKYDKMINSAELEGNLDLVNSLTEEKLDARSEYLEDYKNNIKSITDQFAGYEIGIQEDIIKNLDSSIIKKFEDDPIQKALAETALSGLDAQNLLPDQEFLIKAQVDAGNVSVSTLLALAKGDSITSGLFVDVIANVGGKDADLAMQIASGFGENETAKQQFLLDIGTEDPSAAKETIDLFNTINKMRGVMGDGADVLMNATIRLKQEDPAAYDDLQNDIDYLNSLDGKEITTTMITEHVGEDVAEIIAENQEYFDSLPPDQQKDYAVALRTMFTSYTDPEFQEQVVAWATANKAAQGSAASIFGQYAGQYMAYMADLMTTGTSVATTEDTEPPPGPGGGGAEPQVDSLLKKLRDLRIATIDMKKGWKGMQEVLSSIFAGGTKELNIFDGLEKQLRDLNLGENLIAMIVGMDPDEFEKRKNELFNIDGTATAALTNMNKAFDAVAIGDYVNGQEKFIQKTNNQFTAIATLTAAGLTLAEAYEAVQDEALAAAIAQGGTADEIARIVELTKKITELKEKDAKRQERIRIAEAVQKTNEEFEKRVQIYQKLSKELENYTDAQINAILSDSNIGSIFLDPSIDSGALTQALADAERKADLELKIRKLTVEGTRGIFEEGFGQAMDAFGRQEQAIELKFKAETSGDDEILRQADEDIAAIQHKLGDYNAELERISWQEEEINDSYEKRFEALDNIADANERIAKAQESQLDIADALSKGDIAAAARAVASLRSQQAQDASKTQREMLEDAQKTQIEGLRSASGLSREEIEDRSQQLERQIFNIEEINKRPAAERIRLATSIRDAEIASLTVLEKTREEWDGIKSGIDMAEASGWKFKETMQEALNVVEKLMKAYPAEKPLPVTPAPTPAPAASSGGGGGQPSKGQWHNPHTGNTIQEDAKIAGYGSWQQYYNEHREGIDPVARVNMATGGKVKKYSGGGMIIPKRMAMGGLASRSRSGPPLQMAMGGRVKGYPMGGLIPYKSDGGFFKSLGSDTIPAMLTPGEFVIRRPAVRGFGLDNLEKINRGTYNDGSVYNYNLAVNVKSDSDPNRIARAVITNIKSIENQRIRGNRL